MSVHWSDLAIVVYLFIAWCWNLPPDVPAKLLISPLSRFVSWMGLWHGWNMFAPNPIRSSRRLAVQVQYADGSRYEWRPPGSLPEGYWRSFVHSHFRKFASNVSAGKTKGLRWSLADFGIRSLNRIVLDKSVPVHVAIVEEEWPVSIGGSNPMSAEPKRKVVFEQQLVDGKLM